MNLHFSAIRDKIKYTGFFIPFTVYFAVFILACFLAYKWMASDQIDADSSYSDILALLLQVAFAFCASILSIAFCSVLISYLYFIYRKKKGGVFFQVTSDTGEPSRNGKQTVKLVMRPVLKPVFGFIRLRLLYDQSHFSGKFSLLENSDRRFVSTSVEGTYQWRLPEIKEYHIQRGIIYFEDFFQFFSIAVALPASSHFFTQPSSRDVKDLAILPRKTEETTTRIDQMRRVEGEYLNYKNFENNDDVRRIVWKIYAKNKELVVRIPEIMDPYASHIYLYASFFSSFTTAGNTAVEIPFLNYYKVITWSVYQHLVKQGMEVRYIPDQEVSMNNTADEQQWVKYSVSTSRWHQEQGLLSYVKTNDASVVIISSLSNADEVKHLVQNHGNEITFIFIKLTDSFKNQHMIDWLQWMFIQSDRDDMDVYKRSWSVSALRQRIKENEKLLTNIVERYQEDKVIV